jgi:heme exporter protein CcmD
MLGGYAGTVLGAYGVTAGLLALLVAVSWRRAVRVRQALARAEARRGGGVHGAT